MFEAFFSGFMAGRVARSPARLCSRDGKLCYYRRREYDLDALCLVSFFCPFFPSLFRYASLLRVTSSVQQSSASRMFVRVLLTSCVLSHFSIPFVLFLKNIYFSVALLLVGVFVVLSYPVRWHFICFHLDCLGDYFGFLCLPVFCDRRIFAFSRMKN